MVRTTVASQLAAIRKQRVLLEKKEQALKSKSHDKLIARIATMAKDAGLTISELTQALSTSKVDIFDKVPSTTKRSTLAGKKVPPKYRNPSNPEQTWTGRGVSPLWVQELKATGSLESALINQSAMH